MARPLASGQLEYPGAPEVPHAWAYLPDLGRLCEALGTREADLPRLVEMPYPGLTLSGQTLADLCGAALDRPVRLRQMAWWPLRLATPVWPLARHLIEMRYLWSMPHRLDPAPLAAFDPQWHQRDAAEAVQRAVTAALAAQSRPRTARAVPPRRRAT